MMDLLNTEAMG